QTSRLAGRESDGGAAYDATQPPAAKIAIDVPRVTGAEWASVQDVGAILKEIDVPPIKLARDEMLIRAGSLPPFSVQTLVPYKPDGAKTPFRDAVEKARKTLHEQLRGKHLREEWPMAGNENEFKSFVREYQEKEVAR